MVLTVVLYDCENRRHLLREDYTAGCWW